MPCQYIELVCEWWFLLIFLLLFSAFGGLEVVNEDVFENVFLYDIKFSVGLVEILREVHRFKIYLFSINLSNQNYLISLFYSRCPIDSQTNTAIFLIDRSVPNSTPPPISLHTPSTAYPQTFPITPIKIITIQTKLALCTSRIPFWGRKIRLSKES